MLFHALASVVLLDFGNAEPQHFVPSVRRKPVERRTGGGELRGERNSKLPQILCAIDPDGGSALLDLCRNRTTVDARRKCKNIDRIFGRQRYVLIRFGNAYFRQRKSDEHGDVLARFIEEAVAHAHLLRGNEQVFRAHLDIIVGDEDQAAGRKLG